jgi:hypothetical protein
LRLVIVDNMSKLWATLASLERDEASIPPSTRGFPASEISAQRGPCAPCICQRASGGKSPKAEIEDEDDCDRQLPGTRPGVSEKVISLDLNKALTELDNEVCELDKLESSLDHNGEIPPANISGMTIYYILTT